MGKLSGRKVSKLRRDAGDGEARGAREDQEQKAGRDGLDSPPPADTVMARVRARFGIDPAVAPEFARSLDEAWTSPAGNVEEDEAELVDAVADCLSVGVPLEAALSSLGSGMLAVGGTGSDEDGAEEDAASDLGAPPPSPHLHGAGRRLLVR
jgi:hypothetical protein